MIQRLLICRSAGHDPYANLALEEALLHRVGKGELILYLWQNKRTVVIGRNQNPWKECRTALLEEEGGHLARRLSGGGAVFHDLGNLNFTFLMSAEDYDLARQLTVLERACRSLGIPAQRSGRNDLLADDRKFSGNAFYSHAGKAYHHGTLMVDVDIEMVQRYLSPSKAKLAAKGVDSVRSRVVNLREFVPDLTIDGLSDALIAALAEAYAAGAHGVRLPLQSLGTDEMDLHTLREKYSSGEWLYGSKLPFTASVEDRCSWGGAEIQFNVSEGVIRAVKVYTDAMDDTLAPKLETALTECAFRIGSLRERFAALSLPAEQKANLLSLLETAL